MNAIITVDELREGSINQDLIEEWDNKLTKYINIVCAKIRTKIDEEQFKIEEGTYIYPEDLKIATISLVDNYYAYFVQLKQTEATGRRTSYTEKIDDYSISETFESTSAFSFFWIPTDLQILDILKKYMESEEYWFWNIDLH